MRDSLRKSGIDVIGDVPWGTHFCQFYQTKEDLVDILVPYFKEGLANNEFCIWVTSQSLETESAKEALRRAVSDFDTYLKKGQIEIIPHTSWYLKEGIFDSERVLKSWIEKFNQALDSNYDGIRISGDISWLEEESWNYFIKYKKRIDNIIRNCRMIALCTCPLHRCSAAKIIDLAVNHQFALIRRDGEWEQIESPRRKKVEEAAFQTVKDWEETFDAVPDLVTIIDNKYRIVRANRAMAARLGITPQECSGLTCYRAVHGTDEPPSFCPHRQLLEDGLEHTVEIQENILGGAFSVSVSPLYNAAGELIGCVHIARDITDRKRIEESLRESEAKYRNIIETANEGIWIIDNEDRTTYVNKKMAEMLGYSPEEMIGRSGWDFTNEKDEATIKLNIEKRQQGIDESHEFKFIRKDGSPLWALVNIKSFFDKDGKFTGSMGMLTDITERKQKEHRINRYNSVLVGINRIFSNVVQAKTEEELANTCLSVALEVTDSQFGFINEIGADGILHDVAKSELAWKQCLMCDRTGHRRPPNDFAVHGLYGGVIINENGFFTNNPSTHPDSIGLPSGHPPLISFLGVPLIQDGKTIGLIAVANREGGYSSEQQEDLEAIAPAIVQALQRKRSEGALELSNLYNRSLIEASLDPLVTIGPDGRITDVNGATELITGHSRTELIGTDFSDYFTEPEKARKGYLRAFEEGLVRDYSLEIQHKNKHITPVLYNASVYKGEYGEIVGVFAAARDITELKKAEEKIQILANAVESSDDAIITKSLDGIITSWNRGAEKVYGYSAEEILGKNISILEPDNHRGEIKYFSEKIKQGESIQHYDTLRIKKDGTIINVSVTLSPVFDTSGKLVAISIIARNITERKKAEEALNLSNIYNRSLIEASLDPLVTIGPDGKITDVNLATELVTGHLRKELIGTDFSDYFTEPEKARTGYQQVFINGKVRDYPLEIKHKNGHITPVLYNASIYRDKDGKVIGAFAAARDITELKKAEGKIRILANAVESSDDAIITNSLDSIISSWNKAAERIFGYSAEEVRGKNISILEPNSLKGEISQLIESIKHGERVCHYETLRLKKNGKIIDVSVTLSPVFDTSGELAAVSTITRDITPRKKAQEALRLSNIYNRSLIEASLDPLVTIWPDGKISDVNKATELITGCSRDKLIGTDFSDYFSEPEKARTGYQQAFIHGEIRDYPLEIRHKNGHVTPVIYNASIYNDETGKVIGVFAAARDISERKRAEAKLKETLCNLENLVKERTADLEKAYDSLKESEEGLAEAQRIAHVGNWDLDLVNDKGYWSDELYNIFGRNPEDPPPSYNELLNYIHPEDRDYVDNSIKKGLKEVSKSGIDYRIILANGEERTVHSRAEVLFNEQNIPVRVKGIVQDITERRKTEEKVRILANAVESSKDAIVTFSLDGIVLSWNRGAEQIYGYLAEEILDKNISIVEPDNLKGEIKSFSEKVIQEEKSQHYETLRLRKDGTKINLSAVLSPVFNTSGRLVAILAIGRDITKHKREERALRESEARLRRFYESGMFGVLSYNIDGSITEANDKFLEIVGYSREDLRAGRVNWKNMTPPEYRLQDEHSVADLRATGESVILEKEYIRKDGSRVPIILGATIFDRECQEGIAFVIDNTEKKKAEQALAELDKIQIKEIHHRIKNNLQVISSLLDLQAERFQDDQVLEAFIESQNRVISMALIHEELYKGEGMDNLDFSAYLQELAENLFQTYKLRSKNIRLSMELEENSFFDMDIAVPLGIIVNELVSNSLKHAFSEGEEGEIRIRLLREEKNDEMCSLFSLTVSDNGKGIPENIKLECLESLGLQLVNILVDQLDGKIELKKTHGTEFRITFNVAERP